MRKQNVLIVSGLLCVLVISGCATQQPFYYQQSEKKQARDSALPLRYLNVVDQRTNKKIDEVFVNPTVEEVNKVVQQELKNSGLFSRVMLSRAPSPSAKADPRFNTSETAPDLLGGQLTFQGTLKKLTWEISEHHAMLAAVFPAGFSTGGFGGLAHGGKDVDVYGHAVMHFRIENPITKNVLVDKEYVARVKETMPQARSKTPKTKAEIVGKALGHVMKQLKADLQKKLPG